MQSIQEEFSEEFQGQCQELLAKAQANFTEARVLMALAEHVKHGATTQDAVKAVLNNYDAIQAGK